jgi:hypothetical protein
MAAMKFIRSRRACLQCPGGRFVDVAGVRVIRNRSRVMAGTPKTVPARRSKASTAFKFARPSPNFPHRRVRRYWRGSLNCCYADFAQVPPTSQSPMRYVIGISYRPRALGYPRFEPYIYARQQCSRLRCKLCRVVVTRCKRSAD